MELSPGSKCFQGLRWASLWSKNGLVGADTERSGSTHGISNDPLECSFDELSIYINTYNKNVNPIPYNR